MSTTEELIDDEMSATVNKLADLTEKYRKSHRTEVLAMLEGVRAAADTLVNAIDAE